MSPLEQQILDKLDELTDAAKQAGVVGPKPDILAILQSLDQLAAKLPKETDAQLVHFLQRKSYEKAREWLREAQRGGAK